MYCAFVQMHMKASLPRSRCRGSGRRLLVLAAAHVSCPTIPVRLSGAHSHPGTRHPPRPGPEMGRGQQEFQVWCRGGDGEMGRCYTIIIWSSSTLSHSGQPASRFSCSCRSPGETMSVRGLLRLITAPPTLAAESLQPGHGRSLRHL